MKRFIVLVALPLLLSTDLGHTQDAKAAIDEALIAWETAFNAGDGKALAELYTEDAALFPPDAERVDGRAAIAEFWQKEIDTGPADVELDTVELVETGDLAYEVGAWALTAAGSDGERVPVSGKYLVVWQRADDDVWRLYRDIWNMNPAPAE